MLVIKYDTQEEADQIIWEQTAKGMVLVEVSNVIGGNYLTFSNDPGADPAVIGANLNAMRSRLASAEQSAAENSLTTQQLIETLFDLGVISHGY